MKELESALRDKRTELDEQLAEKAKLVLRCEQLETKALQLKNSSQQPSDGSKPSHQQARNNSLVDKLRANNAIA